MVEVPAKRITVGLVISWVLGVFIAVGAFVGLFSNPLAGILGLAAAAILLPPTNALMARKLHVALSGGLKFILVVGLLIAMGVVTGKSGTGSESGATPSPKAQASPAEVVTVDVATFVAEFDKNQLAAEAKWEGKTIKFTGKVGNISEDITGTPFVIVQPRTAGQYYFDTAIHCSFESKQQIIALENGKIATFQGTVDTQLGDVLVDDCSVVTP
jgi:hypothetical protein